MGVAGGADRQLDPERRVGGPDLGQLAHDLVARRDVGEPEERQRGRRPHRRRRNALRPAKRARAPSSPSIRRSWLYLATRSERDSEPVLIWPAAVPAARSAIVVSSVSPERCEITVP